MSSIFNGLVSPIFLAPSAYSGQDVNNIGAIYTKTITLKGLDGNPGQTIFDYNGGYCNNLGLPNVGLAGFISRELNSLYSTGCKVIVSIAGTQAELIEMTGVLAELYKDRIFAIEANVSCPNINKVQQLNCGMIDRVISCMGDVCNNIPLMVKLPPWPDHVTDMANIARIAGASAVTATNTIPGLMFDDSGGVILGGISGPTLRPISMRCVYEIKKHVNIPVVACGGIESADDIYDYLELGADAVAVCSAEIKSPGTTNKLARGYVNAKRILRET